MNRLQLFHSDTPGDSGIEVKPAPVSGLLLSGFLLTCGVAWHFFGIGAFVCSAIAGLWMMWFGVDYGRRYIEAHGLDPDNLPVQEESS